MSIVNCRDCKIKPNQNCNLDNLKPCPCALKTDSFLGKRLRMQEDAPSQTIPQKRQKADQLPLDKENEVEKAFLDYATTKEKYIKAYQAEKSMRTIKIEKQIEPTQKKLSVIKTCIEGVQTTLTTAIRKMKLL